MVIMVTDQLEDPLRAQMLPMEVALKVQGKHRKAFFGLIVISDTMITVWILR